MIYSITASKDATIYEGTGAATDLNTQYMNTGGSEILEINKIVSSSQTIKTYNSRMLLYFNIDWPGLVDLGMPTGSVSRSAYLNLYSTEANNLARSHSLAIHPISKDWDVGTGRATNKPKTTDGVSWTNYAGEDLTGQAWDTASAAFISGETGSNSVSNNGGGQWWTSSIAKYEYNYDTDPNQDLDMRADVDDILSDWSESVAIGSSGNPITNRGFLIKLSGSLDSTTSLETDRYKYGNIKYFSRNTHTIYPPRLEICWEDYNNVTGSLAALDMTDTGAVFFYLKNNRGSYKRGGKIKFNVNGRLKYPVKTYGTTSAELDVAFIEPDRMHYSIIDCKTDEVVIPYSHPYTKISVGPTIGNYFEIYSDSLFEERDYKIQLRYRPGTSSKNYTYYNIKDTFKVVR